MEILVDLEILVEFYIPVFFLLALFYFGIGIRILLTGRPFLLSGRWFLVNGAIAFAPIPIVSLIDFFKFEDPLLLFNLLVFLLFFFSLVMMTKGYIAMGITNESFGAGIHTALQQLNITFEEALGHIKLTSHDLELQVTIHSWNGTAQLRMKRSNGKPILDEIAKAVVAYYKAHKPEMNKGTVIFTLISGVLMLAFGIIFIYLRAYALLR